MICETVARSGSPEPPPPTAAAAEIWGTWEDLLLACAVSRLGSKTWDSVASEVRSRSPAAAAAAALLTPDACRRRYRHLQSQFSSSSADAADGVGEIPWVEELRKLRVAELRREVQRYDVSIGSLQLKVKRLKEEERERTLGRAAANGEKGPDLKAEEDRKDLGSPGSGPADRISAGDSGRSCKESNSTDPKGRGVGGGDVQQPAREATDDPCPRGQSPVLAAAAEEKSVAESSYNGSSDTIARGAAAGRTDSGRAPVQEVGESGESFAESKGVEAESRNSDVQSSAGLPRRRRGRRRKAVGRPCGGNGDEKEKETDANSVRAPEESQPLLVFLEIIRSHKCGFMFENRLKSQDGAVYNGLVKQHVDLEMVRGRIMGGGYTRLEFFRDLLLICNNAIVYYQKESPEFNAAVKLRQLVNNEISGTSENSSKRPLPSPPPLPPMPMSMPRLELSKETTKKEATPPPAQPPEAPLPPPAAPKLKPELELVRPSKPGPLPPQLIACKKRSSITTKPPAMISKREAKADPDQEEKENGVPKEKVKKRRTSVSGTRGPRTNKTRVSKGGGGGGGGGGEMVANRKLDPAEEESDAPEPAATKAEKEKKTTAGGAAAFAKKKSAAIFLDRLNRAQPKAKGGAPSAKGELMETLKANGNGGGAEQKKGEHQRKGGGGGGGGRKEQQATRQSTSAAAKQAAAGEQSAAPVKRGRPPKRAPPPLPLTPPAKRAREEKATPQPSRKRGRR